MDFFQRVEGQEIAKLMLQPAVEARRCPSGYLFFGPAGVGKKTMALEVARLLNCQGDRAEVCSCVSCRKLRSGTHPDVQVYSPKNRVFKVGTVRQIRAEVAYKPYLGGWKVVVLDQAEKMSPEAANAFLKVLEEPPEPTVFIILFEGEEILPTIQSRCVSVPFFPLTSEQVRRVLEKSGQFTGDLKLESNLASGIVAKAWSYADRSSWPDRSEALLMFLRLWKGDLSDSMPLYRDFGRKQGEVLSKLDFFQSFLRDVWLIKAGREDLVRNVDHLEALRPLAEFSRELLAMVIHRTNNLALLLHIGDQEVQLRAYLAAVLYSISLESS